MVFAGDLLDDAVQMGFDNLVGAADIIVLQARKGLEP